MFILNGDFEKESEQDLMNSFVNYCVKNDCYKSVNEILHLDEDGNLIKQFSSKELMDFETEANSEIEEGLLMAIREYTTTRDLEREYKSNLL